MDEINERKSNVIPDSVEAIQPMSLEPNLQFGNERKGSDFYEEIFDNMVDDNNYEHPVSQKDDKYVELYKPNYESKNVGKPYWTRKKLIILIAIVTLIIIAVIMAVVLIVLATASNIDFILFF